MTIYIVDVRENWIQPVRVEADTPEEAQEKAGNGEGDVIASLFEYVSTNDDYENWTVSEEQENEKELH